MILHYILPKKLKSDECLEKPVIPAHGSSFLCQWGKKPSQAFPKPPEQPASPEAQKETQNTKGFVPQLNPKHLKVN